MTSYVDFYKKHDICPVVNQICPSYLQKRVALYHQLGIIPALIKDKRILEFGPGNGINSIYTQSLKPKEFVLVDANPKSLENCRQNFKEAFPGATNYRFEEQLIEDYQSTDQSDVVICEGLIPHQYDPKRCAKHVASFTASGGLLILTCHDFISFLSEHLRSFIAYIQAGPDLDFNTKANVIASYLKDHFSILKSMSRTHKDWVIDNTMQTDHWQVTPLFSIVDAIQALDEDFMFLASSPSFFSDWRWYKDLTGEKDNIEINQHAIDCFWRQAHNFIDNRFTFADRNPQENQSLYALSREVKSNIATYMNNKSVENEQVILNTLDQIHSNVITFSTQTAQAIDCYRKNLKRVFEKKPTQFEHFQNWWGRGMQFISLVKVS